MLDQHVGDRVTPSEGSGEDDVAVPPSELVVDEAGVDVRKFREIEAVAYARRKNGA